MLEIVNMNESLAIVQVWLSLSHKLIGGIKYDKNKEQTD